MNMQSFVVGSQMVVEQSNYSQKTVVSPPNRILCVIAALTNKNMHSKFHLGGALGPRILFQWIYSSHALALVERPGRSRSYVPVAS